jgi:hypothetical protein
MKKYKFTVYRRNFSLCAIATVLVTIFLNEQALAQIQFNENKDEFTGEDNSSVYSMPTSGDQITLFWKCIDGKLNVGFLHAFMGGDETRRVRIQYKFDNKEPSSELKAALNRNHTTTFLSSQQAEMLTEAALSSKTLLLRLTDPYNNERQTATYSLEGFKDNFFRQNCVASFKK